MKKLAYMIGVSLVAIGLSGCSATGPQYAPIKAYDNDAKLVVYNKSLTRAATIGVNDEDQCRLAKNGFFATSVEPNKMVAITARENLDFVRARFTFVPAKGETYYLRVTQNYATSVNASVFGILAASGTTFTIEDGTEAEALTTKGGC